MVRLMSLKPAGKLQSDDGQAPSTKATFMTNKRSVLWIDHQAASLLSLDAAEPQLRKIKLHTHSTGQHKSAVRTEHEFFGEVCDALATFQQVLLVGPHVSLSDFDRYIHKHRPHLAETVVGQQVVDHPTDPQLAALGREFFALRDAGRVTSLS